MSDKQYAPDERRPPTSADRYREQEIGTGDVCGSAAPHRPQGERYFPLDNPIAAEAFAGRDPLPSYAEVRKMEDLGELRKYAARAFGDLLDAPPTLPTSALARKELPMATGVLDYFPAALVAIAGLSRVGNEQHNPGKPMHWDRAKSGDEADALFRHLVERGTVDTDGIRHSVKVAWRALALLQKELEAEGLAPVSRGSR